MRIRKCGQREHHEYTSQQVISMSAGAAGATGARARASNDKKVRPWRSGAE